jgi:hypothetical protein
VNSDLSQYLNNRNHDGAIDNKNQAYIHSNAPHLQHNDGLSPQAIASNQQDTYKSHKQNSKTSARIDDLTPDENFLKFVNAVLNLI